MYERHFALRQRPFPNVPDAACYFPAAGHEETLACLSQGLDLGEGMVMLTAEPGLGKTLIAHRLVERLAAGIVPVLLTGSRMHGSSALLQAILFDLSLPYEGKSEQELRLALTDALLKTFQGGGRTVLIVDEAHHLTPELLEELRLLGNLEAHGGKAVQVVLVGLPSLTRTLRRSELAIVRQRLVVRATLTPLTQQESAEYVRHHVKLAGGNVDRLFTSEAVDLIAENCKGVPRLLNQASHQALLLACAAGADAVDAEAAHGALEVLGLGDEARDAATEEAEPLEECHRPGGLLPLKGGEVADDEIPGIAPRRFVAPARPA